MRYVAFLLALTAMTGLCLGQGGTNDGLGLTSAVNAGGFDASDKQVATGDILSVRMADGGAGVVGQVIALAGDLVPCNFPICVDLDGNPGTCEVELGVNLFFLIDPGMSALPLTLPGVGFQIGLPIPASASLFSAPDDEALRLQGACANASAPLGISITNIVEAFVGQLALAGPTSDDGNVAFDIGAVDFYGTTQNTLFVNSNGNLTFGSGDSDFSSTEAELLSDQPRIAPAWTDISPNIDGNVSVTIDRSCGNALNSITVNYNAIPQFNAGAGNNLHTFAATLYGNGDIDLAWGTMDHDAADNAVVGISPGGGLSLANPLDFVPGGAIAGGSLLAMYQNFDGSCGNELGRLNGAMGSFVYDGIDSYSYTGTAGMTPAASAASVTPNSGVDTGGDTVTIAGSYFDAGATYSVEFGAGNFASAIVVVDPCTLTCTTPAGTGTVDIIVTDTTTLASSTLVGAFTYMVAGINIQNFSVTDDGFANYALSIAPASFTFYGVTYTDLWVNANGNVTFGAGSNDFSPAASVMVGAFPRIAPFWADLAPSTIVVTETVADITIAYNAGYHSGGAGPNVATVVLDKASGGITLNITSGDAFNGVAASNSCITGISAGSSLGINAAPDLSGAPLLATGANDALFEAFSGGSFDLSGLSIPFTPTGVGVGPYQVN